MLLVTLDTNVLDDAEVASLHAGSEIPCQFAAVTVSIRERGDANGLNIASVPETLVWGESSWGEAVWGVRFPKCSCSASHHSVQVFSPEFERRARSRLRCGSSPTGASLPPAGERTCLQGRAASYGTRWCSRPTCASAGTSW